MLKEDIVVGKKYRWHAGQSPTKQGISDTNLKDQEIVEVVGVSATPGRKFPVLVKFIPDRDRDTVAWSKEVVAPQELSELD